jgi:hypothetical protein
MMTPAALVGLSLWHILQPPKSPEKGRLQLPLVAPLTRGEQNPKAVEGDSLTTVPLPPSDGVDGVEVQPAIYIFCNKKFT